MQKVKRDIIENLLANVVIVNQRAWILKLDAEFWIGGSKLEFRAMLASFDA